MDDEPLVPPDDLDNWVRQMWQQRERLCDLDADVLDLLCHFYLQRATPEGDAVVDVDELLAKRGLKKKLSGTGRRGGYEAKQRKEMLHALSRVQNIWVQVADLTVYEDNGRGHRRKTTLTIESRAFVTTDRMGQRRIDGFMDVCRFIFRPGKVLGKFLVGPGRQFALLSARAVEYDPHCQFWEKRLARYLSWQWRVRARSGDYMRSYRVATLLKAVGQEVNPKRPTRTRERLEQALDTLQTDEVVAGWQYQSWDESRAARQQWMHAWLEATVLVEPPDAIRETTTVRLKVE